MLTSLRDITKHWLRLTKDRWGNKDKLQVLKGKKCVVIEDTVFLMVHQQLAALNDRSE